MARNSKRSVKDMFSGAIVATEDATIAQLKEEIESLKSQSATSLEISINDIVALQLPGELKQPRLYFDRMHRPHPRRRKRDQRLQQKLPQPEPKSGSAFRLQSQK